MLDKYANETINQKIIEDVYEVDKITQSTIILSHNAEDNHQFETEDSKIFLNESDADEYAKLLLIQITSNLNMNQIYMLMK